MVSLMRAGPGWTKIGGPMNAAKLSTLLGAALASAAIALAAPAGAAQVSYIDGGQVWISTLDGAQKRSLSGPSPDAKVWTEAAQSDNGTVIGVRREAGKIANLNATSLWGPDGTKVGDGALTSKPGWSLYAYPVTLDLTPDGKTVVYGFSASRVGVGGFEAEFGTYAEISSAWYGEPVRISAVESGTLVGSRMVGKKGSVASVERAGAGTPYTDEFEGWFGMGGAIERVDVAATGTVAAAELRGEPDRVAMIPFAGLGAPPPTDGSDCFLPTVGDAEDASISQDGTTVAWRDARGVVVAGTPLWFPSALETTCNLSRPPLVISATGIEPSIGGSLAATPAGAPGGGGAQSGGGGKGNGGGKGIGGGAGAGAEAPKVTSLAAKLKASALRAGVPLTVKVAGPGKVTAVGKVGAKLVAKGEKRAKRAGKVTISLQATKAFRTSLAQFAGKKLTIKITAGGRSTTVKRTLG